VRGAGRERAIAHTLTTRRDRLLDDGKGALGEPADQDTAGNKIIRGSADASTT